MHICGQTQARVCLEVRGQLEGGIPSLLLPHVSGNQIPAIGLGSRHFCQLGCLSWKKKTHLVNSEGVRAPEPADLWLQVVLCVCEPSLLRCTTSTLPPPLPPSLPSGLEPRALSSKAKILPLLYTPTQ